MKKIVVCILVVVAFFNSLQAQKTNINKGSCSQTKYFYKLVDKYRVDGEFEKSRAAKFIVDNLIIHKSIDYKWVDSLGSDVAFNELDYQDLDKALDVFYHLKDSIRIHPENYTVYDTIAVTDSLLLKNIDLAYTSWKENPWSKSYDFTTFCEYILPYRSLVEPLEDWREEYQFLTTKSIQNVADKTDPVKVSSAVVLGLKDYRFLGSRPDPIPVLSPKQLLFRRAGACPDLANLALLACRSIGLAATFDFTPHYGASSNRHYWNTIVDNNGKHIPFNGNSYGNTDGLPYAYQPAKEKRLAKVYRRTYSIQENSLAFKENIRNIPNTFLRDQNIVDVTPKYVETAIINIPTTGHLHKDILYINVFNTGKWRIVDWAKQKEGQYTFKNLGCELVYLPSMYIHNKNFYSPFPILLNVAGEQTTLEPDYTQSFDYTFNLSNALVNPFYKEHNSTDIQNGEVYSLLVWYDGWKKVDTQIATGNIISFKGVPKNGLFILSSKYNNGYERIFMITPTEKKIVWY